MRLNSAKDLDVYKMSYDLAMQLFELSKGFPAEEKFALIGQIRRSSRSVCSNLREAWAKLYRQKNFAELDKVAEMLRSSREKFHSGRSRLFLFYASLSPAMIEVEKVSE